MSDTLKGQVAGLEDQDDQQQEPQFIVVVLERIVGGTSFVPLVGSLVSVLYDEHVELEMRVELEDGFHTMVIAAKSGFRVNSFKMAMGESHVEVNGQFTVEAIRIQEIDHAAQMCVLAMKLRK
jgi:hypothetical protein